MVSFVVSGDFVAFFRWVLIDLGGAMLYCCLFGLGFWFLLIVLFVVILCGLCFCSYVA